MKIIIVGGGTAGWLAAFMLNKIYKHSVTVIESSKVGIIGVGEGGTHILGSLINNDNFFGFNAKEFLIATNGSPKLAVHHKNWPNTYYMPIDIMSTPNFEDFLPLAITKDIDIHVISDMGLFIEQQHVPIKKDETGTWPSDFSFHFDGTLVGMFFKNKCADEVNVIDAVVEEVILTEIGDIKELRLDNGNLENGDFYIDCTGFKKLLMNSLKNKWVSYSKYLLMNTAIPFRLPFFDVKPLTKAEALSSGWTWDIPTTVDQGLGYSYCDQFITYEQAVKELEDRYRREINPVKKIMFDPGRFEELWSKNCVALGLAAAFVEPLEATSLHATMIQISEFGKRLDTNWDKNTRNEYNKDITKLYDNIKDFIALHYMGGRTDTEFWKYCKNEIPRPDFVLEIIEISKNRLLTENDIDNPFNSLSYRAWNQVLAGLGKFSKDVASSSLSPGSEDRYNQWRRTTLEKMKDYKTLKEVLDARTDWVIK
jgi:tryptophan halogenase